MAGTNFIGYGPTTQTDREMAIVEGCIKLLGELATVRANLNQQMEEVAALIMPSHRGTFIFGSEPVPYDKKTDQQVDATGMLALSRFMAICDSLLTPRSMFWHGLSADDDYVMKDRATRLWFYNTARKLFKFRYSSVSNFTAQNQAVFQSLGAFGTGVMFIDHFYDLLGRRLALRYKALAIGQIYMTTNHQGLYDGFIRIIRMTAQQAMKVPGWKEKLGEIDMFKNALEAKSQRKFVFLHYVCPRDDYNPYRIGSFAFSSYYMCQDSKTLLSEGGYNSLPIAASRYQQAPEEQDGRSPAMDVLPSLKTLNAEKKVFLKQGHRAADPIILLADDGLVNMNMKPGAQNKGGWSAEGKPLAGILPSGDIQISKEMMADEKGLINDAFLVALFQIMTERGGMTATEVIERINEKGILIAPTLGRQEGEYLGPMIDRELVLMSDMGVLDPMPPRLREAQGEYKVVYTSPLSRAMRAQEAAGFMRTIEGVKELVNITGDQGLLDPFNFDVAIPQIAEIQNVPEPWMASPDEIKAKKQARAKVQQMQQQIQAAPAAAAMLKAQAAAAKAGTAAPAPVAPASRSLVSTGEGPGL